MGGANVAKTFADVPRNRGRGRAMWGNAGVQDKKLTKAVEGWLLDEKRGEFIKNPSRKRLPGNVTSEGGVEGRWQGDELVRVADLGVGYFRAQKGEAREKALELAPRAFTPEERGAAAAPEDAPVGTEGDLQGETKRRRRGTRRGAVSGTRAGFLEETTATRQSLLGA